MISRAPTPGTRTEAAGDDSRAVVIGHHGAVAAEYAFLIVFIAIAAAIGMVTLGNSISDYFITFGNALLGAGNAIDTGGAS